MELSDLKKSVSELSDAELHQLLTSIRANRRVSKRPPAVKRESAPKTEISTSALLNAINPEQAAMLLAMLEGKK